MQHCTASGIFPATHHLQALLLAQHSLCCCLQQPQRCCPTGVQHVPHSVIHLARHRTDHSDTRAIRHGIRPAVIVVPFYARHRACPEDRHSLSESHSVPPLTDTIRPRHPQLANACKIAVHNAVYAAQKEGLVSTLHRSVRTPRLLNSKALSPAWCNNSLTLHGSCQAAVHPNTARQTEHLQHEQSVPVSCMRLATL
jgi:hypothetical protein